MLSPVGKHLVQLGGAGMIAALLLVFRDRNPVAVLAFFIVALVIAALVSAIIVHVMRERRTMRRLGKHQSNVVANTSCDKQ
jgi:tetrahydromethanopterin S-methyltransferase subunit C